MAKKKDGNTQSEQEKAAPVLRKKAQKKGASGEKIKAKPSQKKAVLVEQTASMPAGKLVCVPDTEDAPSRTDIVTQARLYGPASIETLAEVMQCGTEASRVAAAKSLLDRGFGKVDQTWPSDEVDMALGRHLGDDSAATMPPVPALDGLDYKDLVRISSLVWDETHKTQ